jgi:TRAP-type C4-dicarboxylate transport system permease small subunit
MIERFERYIATLSDWLAWVGFAGLLLMMVITCADVIGAKIFLRPVFGAIDIVILSQQVAMAFAVSATLIYGRHVQVEFFMNFLPARLRALTDTLMYLLCLALFAVIIWRLIVYGYMVQVGAETSSTARIPLYPFAYGIAFACIPISLSFILNALKSILTVAHK